MEMIDERDDFYFRLGVQRNATSEEIRRAYYRLARHYHPDKISKGRYLQSKGKFRLIHEAYSTLIDINNRKLYDQKLAETGPPCWSVDDDEDDVDAFDQETMENILNHWDISANKGKKDNDEREITRLINLSRRTKPNITSFYSDKSDILVTNGKVFHKLIFNSSNNIHRSKMSELGEDHAENNYRKVSTSDFIKGNLCRQQYHRPRNHPCLMKRTLFGISRLPDSKYIKCPEALNESHCEKCGKPFGEIESHRRVCNELSSQSETVFGHDKRSYESSEQSTKSNDDHYHHFKRQSKAAGQYISPDSAPCPFCRVRIAKSHFGSHISSCMLSKHAIRRPTSAIGGLSSTELGKQYAKTISRPKSKITSYYH